MYCFINKNKKKFQEVDWIMPQTYKKQLTVSKFCDYHPLRLLKTFTEGIQPEKHLKNITFPPRSTSTCEN